MEDYKVCEECGGKMFPTTIDQEFHFNGKTIVLKGLNAYKCEDCDEVVFEKEEVKMIERLVQAFDALPTADVAEVRHGKWIEKPQADGLNGCSICGVMRFGKSNYCPNCGARMDL